MKAEACGYLQLGSLASGIGARDQAGRHWWEARTANACEYLIGRLAKEVIAQDDGIFARDSRVDEAGHDVCVGRLEAWQSESEKREGEPAKDGRTKAAAKNNAGCSECWPARRNDWGQEDLKDTKSQAGREEQK